MLTRPRFVSVFVRVAVARNRVVAGGRRLLSKSGQQLITGTAFKYVIARLMLAFCRDVCPPVAASSLFLSQISFIETSTGPQICFRHLPLSLSRVECHVSRACTRTRQYLALTYRRLKFTTYKVVSVLRGVTYSKFV